MLRPTLLPQHDVLRGLCVAGKPRKLKI